jgi:hypothetical protein
MSSRAKLVTVVVAAVVVVVTVVGCCMGIGQLGSIIDIPGAGTPLPP